MYAVTNKARIRHRWLDKLFSAQFLKVDTFEFFNRRNLISLKKFICYACLNASMATWSEDEIRTI